ncbi:MAG: DUF58 domain-containing protein [Planctomycetes bacterium]|nr:DUF58 domain-containing protein [Planctomycetota bacterium]
MERVAVAELLKKVRRIEIVARRMVDDLFGGQYHSVFRGRGMEFDEVREYQPGDDVRSIDWNVTARSGTAFVKRYREERELTVLFLVDVSASQGFGSGDRSKLETAAEAAALLAVSALKNGDKVGMALFADDVVKFLPPRKGKGAVLRLLRELVGAELVPRETRLDVALEFAHRVQRRRAVVFLLTDFLAPLPESSLLVASKRHDLVAIGLRDPREGEWPDAGLVRIVDPETGAERELDLSHRGVRDWLARRRVDVVSQHELALKRAGVDTLMLGTHEPCITSLQRFFRMRERRR